jgi:hypothetical protein
MRMTLNRWLAVVCTVAALVLRALTAVHGYAWQMIWLPAVVAGAAWPHRHKRVLDRCLRRLLPGRDRSA